MHLPYSTISVDRLANNFRLRVVETVATMLCSELSEVTKIRFILERNLQGHPLNTLLMDIHFRDMTFILAGPSGTQSHETVWAKRVGYLPISIYDMHLSSLRNPRVATVVETVLLMV